MSVRPLSPVDFPVGTLNEHDQAVCKELLSASRNVDVKTIRRILPKVRDEETVREARKILEEKKNERFTDIHSSFRIYDASALISNKLNSLKIERIVHHPLS